MSETTLIDGPGWFGKMPGTGDFASRRLPQDFVQRWDDWLQRGLGHARATLGADWLDAYLVAPVLRFWLSPGLIGPTGWAGVVMPSVDRVGRHFPLTVAQPVDTLAAALASRAWYQAIDAAARTILHLESRIDDLEDALARAHAPAGDPEAADVQQAQRCLQAHRGGAPCSVWWCGDADRATRLQGFGGLPPPAAFVTALGGSGT